MQSPPTVPSATDHTEPVRRRNWAGGPGRSWARTRRAITQVENSDPKCANKANAVSKQSQPAKIQIKQYSKMNSARRGSKSCGALP
jgi:hypothetical protein